MVQSPDFYEEIDASFHWRIQELVADPGWSRSTDWDAYVCLEELGGLKALLEEAQAVTILVEKKRQASTHNPHPDRELDLILGLLDLLKEEEADFRRHLFPAWEGVHRLVQILAEAFTLLYEAVICI
jgi:hypothetical protein